MGILYIVRTIIGGNVGTARCQGDLRKVLNGPGVATLNLPGNLVVIGNVEIGRASCRERV